MRLTRFSTFSKNAQILLVISAFENILSLFKGKGKYAYKRYAYKKYIQGKQLSSNFKKTNDSYEHVNSNKF